MSEITNQHSGPPKSKNRFLLIPSPNPTHRSWKYFDSDKYPQYDMSHHTTLDLAMTPN